MKKVFSSAEDTVHVYAQRSQSEGRSSNIFFYGDKIYSYGYHYLLGEFFDDGKAILINDRGYSNTTAKHIGLVRYGTRQYKQFFTTRVEIDHVHRQVKHLTDKLAKARKPETYVNEILSLWESMNEYIKYRKDKNIPKDVRYKEIKKIVTELQKDSANYKEKLAEAKKKAEIAKIRADKKKIKELLPKFLNYDIQSFRVGDKDFLRISRDGESVETSQGVQVDVQEAKVLYRAILAGVDIVGYRIGSYTVNSINGTLKIGCHNIDMDSVHNVGKLINA